MNKPVTALAAFSLFTATAACALAEESKPLAIGSPAPLATVKMKSVDGKEITIAGLPHDKGTLVFFTCNHCPYSKAWESRLTAAGNAAMKKGIGVVAINPNDPKAYDDDKFEDMQARAKAAGMMFPYAVDSTSDIARAFGATKTPEAFLFGKDGKLVYHGAIDDNAYEPNKVEKRWLEQAIDAVAAGAAVPLAETKALGCSIKFRSKS